MENNKSQYLRAFIKEILMDFREWERKWDLYDLNKSEKPDSIEVFINTLIENNKYY